MTEERIVVVHCLDAPSVQSARQRLLESHSRRIRTAPFTLLSYGPLLDAAGDVAVGSLFVVSADGPETVAEFFSEDPFRTGGVWRDVQVHAFRPSANGRVRLALGAPTA